MDELMSEIKIPDINIDPNSEGNGKSKLFFQEVEDDIEQHIFIKDDLEG